jgi:hypothetical protein
MWLLDRTWVVSGSCQYEIPRMYLILYDLYYVCLAFLFLVSKQVKLGTHLLIGNNIMCGDKCYVPRSYV